MLHMFFTTSKRCSTYFVGVLFGIYMEKNRVNETRIGSWVKCAILANGTTLIVLSFIDFSKWMSLKNFVTILSIVEPFHKICYASFIGFIIMFCRTESSSLLNKFLSARIFIPLSKLSYCIYLVFPIVQIYQQYLPMTFITSSVELLVFDLMIAIFFSIILHVIIEEPFRKLGNLVAIGLFSKKLILNADTTTDNCTNFNKAD